MTPEDLARLRERYIALFGLEGTAPGECEVVESALGVLLPDDFKQVATFYRGGLLGGISHNAITTHGPATNIVEETTRLREAVRLPHDLVVLAEPPDSLIVMNVGRPQDPQVVWCSAFDIARLAAISSLTEPDLWPSYSSFFGHLLDEEEEERAEG